MLLLLSLLLLGSTEGGTDQLGVTTKLDTEDTLKLGKQLNVGDRTTSLKISNLK
jgi:hypothetical protein